MADEFGKRRLESPACDPPKIPPLVWGAVLVAAATPRRERPGEGGKIAMNMKMTVLALLCAAPFTACDVVWNAANRSSLRADVAELLAKGGLPERALVCNMIGTTRGGTCSFSGSAEEVAAVTKSLALWEVRFGDGEGGVVDPSAAALRHACPQSRRVGKSSSVKAFGLGSRPPELRLKSGSAFEFILFYWDSGNSDVCVEVAYSYG